MLSPGDALHVPQCSGVKTINPDAKVVERTQVQRQKVNADLCCQVNKESRVAAAIFIRFYLMPPL